LQQFLTIAAILGTYAVFFINMLFGFLAFWAPDVWAPRFLFFVIMFFVSGSTFPLDIYPEIVVKYCRIPHSPTSSFFPQKFGLNKSLYLELR
jgi:ABC-type uncharacterized transport system permease subunit